MPIHRGRENTRGYYQWGHGKKYYYIINNFTSRERAYAKAALQAKAAYANGYRS